MANKSLTPLRALRYIESRLAELGEEVVPGGDSRTSQAIDVLWSALTG